MSKTVVARKGAKETFEEALAGIRSADSRRLVESILDSSWVNRSPSPIARLKSAFGGAMFGWEARRAENFVSVAKGVNKLLDEMGEDGLRKELAPVAIRLAVIDTVSAGYFLSDPQRFNRTARQLEKFVGARLTIGVGPENAACLINAIIKSQDNAREGEAPTVDVRALAFPARLTSGSQIKKFALHDYLCRMNNAGTELGKIGMCEEGGGEKKHRVPTEPGSAARLGIAPGLSGDRLVYLLGGREFLDGLEKKPGSGFDRVREQANRLIKEFGMNFALAQEFQVILSNLGSIVSMTGRRHHGLYHFMQNESYDYVKCVLRSIGRQDASEIRRVAMLLGPEKPLLPHVFALNIAISESEYVGIKMAVRGENEPIFGKKPEGGNPGDFYYYLPLFFSTWAHAEPRYKAELENALRDNLGRRYLKGRADADAKVRARIEKIGVGSKEKAENALHLWEEIKADAEAGRWDGLLALIEPLKVGGIEKTFWDKAASASVPAEKKTARFAGEAVEVRDIFECVRGMHGKANEDRRIFRVGALRGVGEERVHALADEFGKVRPEGAFLHSLVKEIAGRHAGAANPGDDFVISSVLRVLDRKISNCKVMQVDRSSELNRERLEKERKALLAGDWQRENVLTDYLPDIVLGVLEGATCFEGRAAAAFGESPLRGTLLLESQEKLAAMKKMLCCPLECPLPPVTLKEGDVKVGRKPGPFAELGAKIGAAGKEGEMLWQDLAEAYSAHRIAIGRPANELLRLVNSLRPTLAECLTNDFEATGLSDEIGKRAVNEKHNARMTALARRLIRGMLELEAGAGEDSERKRQAEEGITRVLFNADSLEEALFILENGPLKRMHAEKAGKELAERLSRLGVAVSPGDSLLESASEYVAAKRIKAKAENAQANISKAEFFNLFGIHLLSKEAREYAEWERKGFGIAGE